MCPVRDSEIVVDTQVLLKHAKGEINAASITVIQAFVFHCCPPITRTFILARLKMENNPVAGIRKNKRFRLSIKHEGAKIFTTLCRLSRAVQGPRLTFPFTVSMFV